MARFRTRLWAVCKYGTMGTAIGVAGIVLPPREMLPSQQLLQVRVLLEGIGRLSRCVGTGCCIFIDYKYTTWGCEDCQDAWNEVHRRSAERLVHLAERNGGLYVKSGQVFASMSHILPRAYTTTMRTLQDAVSSRPFSEVVAVLEQDLGRPLRDVFSHMDATPIAAASLAQVHRATLAADGSDVAVKVQYIDIQQRYRGDMATIKLMLGVCGVVAPGFDFSSIVAKLDATVAQELNFVQEGRNSDRAGRELAPWFGRRVVTPYIHWAYTTPRVLVTDFVDGVRISDGAGMRSRGIDVAQAATDCYGAIGFQLFCSGFAHADPHGGNILVHRPQADGRNWRRGEAQVVLLDHGLYVDMSPMLRRQLARLWTAAVTHSDTALQGVAADLRISDYKLLASMFLQHPYEHFSSFKLSMTPDELRLLHTQAQSKMHEINELIDRLPSEYALVLRSLTALRAINKDLANPVRRPLVLLRYSLRETHAGNAFVLAKALWDAWWSEILNDVVFMCLRWYQPATYQCVEEALAMA